ncbi:hypothetical protein L204_102688 [Cryptococcus depauperatus]|nr:hypothetical protein L204_00561 [Cryptococcus depauperatus CBS 7855]
MSYPQGSIRAAAPQPTQHLNLPYLQPHMSGSASSLLDAVVGQQQHGTPPAARSSGLSPAPAAAFAKQSSSHSSRLGTSSQSHGDNSFVKVSDQGESDWDILSDASARVNKSGDDSEEAIKHLQEIVAKRRSQLPQLENQLAELEAQIKAAEERQTQIKAAEERLARAKTIGQETDVAEGTDAGQQHDVSQ